MLTGNKDTDFIILNQLNDYELGKVCQINKKAQILCDDDIFWFNRGQKYLNFDTLKKAKSFLEFASYKELYKFLGDKKSLINFEVDIEYYNHNVKKYYEKSSLFFNYEDAINYVFSKIEYPTWVNSKEYEKHVKRIRFPGYRRYDGKKDEYNFIFDFINYIRSDADTWLPYFSKEYIKQDFKRHEKPA